MGAAEEHVLTVMGLDFDDRDDVVKRYLRFLAILCEAQFAGEAVWKVCVQQEIDLLTLLAGKVNVRMDGDRALRLCPLTSRKSFRAVTLPPGIRWN